MKWRANDRRQSLAHALLILILLIPGTPGIAGDRTALKGYADFTFGMFEAELRKRISVTSEKTDTILDHDELLLLEASGKIDIGGINFSQVFGIKEGRLVLVQLQNEKTDPRGGCEGWFDRAFGLIKAKYGDPDTEIERHDFMGLSKVFNAKFSFADSAVITLGGVWTSESMNEGVEKCRLLVTYDAPKCLASITLSGRRQLKWPVGEWFLSFSVLASIPPFSSWLGPVSGSFRRSVR